MTRFCVIGSINVDMVARVSAFPQSGQTITGLSFATAFGGKGANQATALGRMGAPVTLCGKVGTDGFGDQYLGELARNGVDGTRITRAEGATGVAMIEVDDAGANRIVVIPGANGAVDVPYIDALLPLLKGSAFCLYQLEIPLDTVAHALSATRALGCVNVLDPAPARELPDEVYRNTDYITPNETETEILTGIVPSGSASIREAASFFFGKGTRSVVIKGGERGCWYLSPGFVWHCPAYPLKAVDTTAAGDSFNAGFVYALDRGMAPQDACMFANAVAALAVTKLGAQAAMPRLDEVECLLQKHPEIRPLPL